MVRISDARMSGTAYGTIVLHVSPEAAVGGPLALVRNGDRIRLSVKERRSTCWWPRTSSQKRKSAWKPPVTAPTRGYAKLYMDHVLQAEHGCDFDFLQKSLATSSAGYSYLRSKLASGCMVQDQLGPAALLLRLAVAQVEQLDRRQARVAGL